MSAFYEADVQEIQLIFRSILDAAISTIINFAQSVKRSSDKSVHNMIIERISDHISAIPTLAEWYQSEWGPYYGIDGPGDARADLQSRCNCDQLPIGLVAIEDNQVLGTAALDLDVTTNLTPSIVGLLVGTAYRRRGIATALLSAAEELACRLEYRQLFVSTTILGDLLNRLGWKAMGEVQFLNAEQGSVYVRDL